MSNWKLMGKPIVDVANREQYVVTSNVLTGDIAVNAYNMGNAGSLSQVRTTGEPFESTGLPLRVKALIRKHVKENSGGVTLC